MFSFARNRCVTTGAIRVPDDLLNFRLVGVSFYQPALERCAQGQPVRFVHEPDNPHDEMAIRVESFTGETIGYVPRSSGLRVAIHQQGRGVSGVIGSIGMSRACLLGASISVALCDDLVRVASYFPDRAPPEPPSGGFRYWVKSPCDVALLVARQKRSASPIPAQRQQYPQRSASEACKSPALSRGQGA